MHIRDLTDRVMKLNMVNSSCRTSLETLLYRQTHKVNSKFQRVPGKMGWFRLKDPFSSRPSITPILLPMSCDDEPIPKAVIIKPRSKKSHRHSPQTDQSDSSSDSSASDNDDILYHKKYRYLKSIAKRLIMDNVSLANQLQDIQQNIEQAQAQKKYLLQRLLDVESRDIPVNKKNSKGKVTSAIVTNEKLIHKTKKPPPKLIKVVSTPPLSPPSPPPPPVIPKSSPKSIVNPGVKGLISTQTRDHISTSLSSDSDKDEKIVQCETKGEEVGRKKRVRRVQPIPLNADGTPVFPIRIGGLQVHSLGKIVWERTSFHSERYIWPVGFESTRTYPSMIDPSRRCLYVCRIVDGGEAPIFEMASEETPNKPIQATSATACHHAVLKAINEARDKQATNAGSGPEFFGFSHPTILNLIQTMSNAEKCTKYKPTHFQQALTRGKQQSSSTVRGKGRKIGIVKSQPKTFYKSQIRALSPPGDPSLAPVMINRQLSSLQRDSSSSISSCSDNESDSQLIIDTRR